MGQIRDRMEGDLRLRNYRERTVREYLRCAGKFAEHFGRSPYRLGREEVRSYLLGQKESGRMGARRGRGPLPARLAGDDLFLAEVKRVVQRDRTVSLDGLVYEVDASLVRETVTLRYDPSRRGRAVQVWHGGRHVHDARLVDAYANCFVKRDRPSFTLVPADKTPVPEPEVGGTPVEPPAPGLRLADLAGPSAKEAS